MLLLTQHIFLLKSCINQILNYFWQTPPGPALCPRHLSIFLPIITIYISLLSVVTDTLFTRACPSLTLDRCAHSHLVWESSHQICSHSSMLLALCLLSLWGLSLGWGDVAVKPAVLPFFGDFLCVQEVQQLSALGWWVSGTASYVHFHTTGTWAFHLIYPTRWIATPILPLFLHGTNPHWDRDLNYFAQILGGGNFRGVLDDMRVWVDGSEDPVYCFP